MSRITGTDAANLMEAYAAVYAPQEEIELTEEQVQEDFENWVNSLVEEGYDLSEYTWEDMYEAYIEEQGGTGGVRAAEARRQQQQAAQASATNKKIQAGEKLSVNTAGPVLGALGARTTVQRNQQGNLNVLGGRGGLDKTIRLGGNSYDRLTQGGKVTYVKRQPEAQQNLKGLSIGPGGFNINNKPVQTTPARPAPAATTPSRPAATAPVSPRPAAPAATAPVSQRPAAPAAAPAAPARTFNPLMQRTFGYQTGNAPSQIAAASAGKPVPSGTALGSAANPQVRAALNLPAKPSLAAPAASTPPAASPQSATAPKPAKKQLTPTQMRQGISASFDPFDVVMGYLIDEGYAETEQAAAVIMANMSDEWRQSIVEAVVGGSAPQMPAPIAKFVDELPNMVQNVLKGRQSSSAKPSPKKSK